MRQMWVPCLLAVLLEAVVVLVLLIACTEAGEVNRNARTVGLDPAEATDESDLPETDPPAPKAQPQAETPDARDSIFLQWPDI